MLLRKIIYCFLFIFFTWLAITTRTHAAWFHPFIAEYGGDTIWAGMFLFFLRIFFGKTSLEETCLEEISLEEIPIGLRVTTFSR